MSACTAQASTSPPATPAEATSPARGVARFFGRLVWPFRLTLHRGWAAASAGGVLAMYLATMARDLTVYDSPELALVAHQLGLGHPIGQPLHTLLGFVGSHLPGVPAWTGLSLLSAVPAALTIFPLFALAERVAPAEARAPAVLTGLALFAIALHRIPWESATRVEVYALAVFFAVYGTARLWTASEDDPHVDFVWTLSIGLSIASNAVIGVAHGVPLFASWVMRRPKARQWRRAAGGGALGLVPYLYVPLVAHRSPDVFVWGAPTTPGALFDYLRGADYAHNQRIDLAHFLDHLGELAQWGLSGGALAFFITGLLGLLLVDRGGLRWVAALASVFCVAFVAYNVVFHPDVPDYCGYLAGPYLLAAVGVAALSRTALERGRKSLAYATVAACFLPFIVAPFHLAGPRETPSVARTLVEGLAAEAPEGAFILVEADHWVAPLLYAQHVEGVRTDLVILPRGLASSSWFWTLTFRRHPTLTRIPLRGPGGANGRLKRMFEAHPNRPVLVETTALARRLGRSVCGVGWLLATDRACSADGPDPAPASRALADAAPRWGAGLEVAARVGAARGIALWELGDGRAIDAFYAGLAGFGLPPPPPLPPRVPVLSAPVPPFARRAAIYDPARNLYLGANLLFSAGQTSAAIHWLDAASADGLPEAPHL